MVRYQEQKKSRYRDHGAVHTSIARIQLCELRPRGPAPAGYV